MLGTVYRARAMILVTPSSYLLQHVSGLVLLHVRFKLSLVAHVSVIVSKDKSLHNALPFQSPKFHLLNSSAQFEILQLTTSSPLSFDIPVGNINHTLYIELCTVTVTLLAFVYIVHQCWTMSKTLYSVHLKMQ